MLQVESQAEVLDILQDFSGSTEPLKQLFWSTLNYDRVNQPTTRRKWPEPAAAILADDPTLFAAGGAHGEFQVLYSRLAKDRLSLMDERIVTSRLLKDHPYSLFVFSDRTQTNWHFLNVKMAENPEKRKLFRRITVGPYEQLRTASQIISHLDLGTISPGLFALSPLVIQERHDQAFDVEPVTNEFFRQYRAVFEQVEALVRGIRDQERKRLFTQRLFNRMMFTAFIQKKGWLKFGGNKNQDYLNALWLDYKKTGNKEMGFYHERLYTLFFHGFGAQDDVGISKINRGGVWADYIGKVPYLNGGLFEEEDDDRDGGIKVPDEAIRAILQDLFSHFNLTVTESTPLDIEVAVDPEMLGRIFEELVTGRHETGSYYTQKPIVSSMCREALKGYLQSSLPKEKSESIARFVDEHEPGGLHDGEVVLEMLRRIRVCDPACGSGAYLLGMLHELMDLRTCLFSAKNIDPISAYERKFEIIEKNVYGVDIDAFAVNIARLRLWLSLAVEFEGDNPPPLPNLKFEIEEGDSLAAPGPQPDQMLMWQKQVEEFSRTKAKYIKAHGETKRTLERKILALKESIYSWTHHGTPVDGFDWAVEFAEVFAQGGFDVVVANPPYVRQELIGEQKPRLKAVFPNVFTSTADLFIFFYMRGFDLMKQDGMLGFISSNKWFKANYGSKLRDWIAENATVSSITDFGDLPVFKSASAYPMIFIARRGKAGGRTLYTEVPSLDPPYPDVRLVVQAYGEALPEGSISPGDWRLETRRGAQQRRAMAASGIPLGEFVSGGIYYGIKTGFQAAFVLTEEQRKDLIAEDSKSSEIILPLTNGRNISRWLPRPSTRWFIFTPIGVNMKRYSAVFDHLKQFRSELENRSDQGNHWWELRPCGYYDLIRKPKIIYQRFQVKPCFALDTKGSMINDSIYFIPSDDLFLLAVLNSRAFWMEVKRTCTKIQNGYQLLTSYIEKAALSENS